MSVIVVSTGPRGEGRILTDAAQHERNRSPDRDRDDRVDGQRAADDEAERRAPLPEEGDGPDQGA